MKIMNNHITFKNLALACSISLLSACGNDNQSSNNQVEPQPTAPTAAKATIIGKVIDQDGKPLVGALVDVSGKQKATDMAGKVSLETAVKNDKTIVLVKKPGYVTTAKEVILAKDKTSTINIKLFKDQINQSFTAANGLNVTTADKKASVSIPQNAITKTDGTPYTGKVNIAMSYFSPEKLDGVQTFAQPYTGQNADGSDSVGLQSVGVTEVKLTDESGNALQLNKSTPATLTFPKNTVSNNADSIPLWFYDESKKIWVRDGEATKQADGSYKGTVTHFTLWNLDIPLQDEATVKGCFEDKNGKRVNIWSGMRAVGWSNRGYSENGEFEVRVPAEQQLELYPLFGGTFTPVKIDKLAKGTTKTFDKCIVVSGVGDYNIVQTVPTAVPVVSVVNPTPNTPPVARNNAAEGVQDKLLLGNVITDADGIDTDADNDTLSVTSFTVDTNGDGNVETFSQAGIANIANVGSFKIDTNGTYEFTPVATFTGNAPVITYTISDGKDATATATLTLKVNKAAVVAPVPVGSKILGYQLETITKTVGNTTIIDDLLFSTVFVEDNRIKTKIESVTGKDIGIIQSNEIKEFFLSPKGLFDVTTTFKNGIATQNAFKVTKLDDKNATLEAINDSDVKTTVLLFGNALDITGKSILSVFDETLSPDIVDKINSLPKSETTFDKGQTCTTEGTATQSKPYIEFTTFSTAPNQNASLSDFTNKANEIFGNDRLSGTWANIPWSAKNIANKGYTNAVLLYQGNIIQSAFYNFAGTFPDTPNKCFDYTKDQIDFVIAAFKKAYPNL